MKINLLFRLVASLFIAAALSACGEDVPKPPISSEDGEEQVPAPTPPAETPDNPEDGDGSQDTPDVPEEEDNRISVTAVTPLSWTKGDRMTLLCPEAGVKTNERITVRNVGDDVHSYEFTTSTMEWGEAEQYDFYAVYPSTQFERDYSLKFSVPSVQYADASGALETTYVNMVAAHMDVPHKAECVTLSFVPAYSQVDVVFTASEDVTISRIVMSSEDGIPVAGEYKASFVDSQWDFEPIATAAGNSSRIAVQVAGDSGLQLVSGEQAHFQAFLMPHEYASGLRVDLLTPDGKVFSATTEGAVPASANVVVDFGSLAALSSCNTVYSDWMRYIPDNALVSDLSIPGTHDAATYGITGFMSSWYTCQSKDFNAQLAGGVRLFDLRPDGSDLMIHHGSSSTGVTLSQALEYMLEYIQDNPTEGCIAFIKEENDWVAENVSPTLAVYADNIVQYASKLSLRQLRGKILVLSRNNYPGTIYGGNFSNGWPDNTSDGSIGVGYNQSSWIETFWLQDQYESGTGTEKKMESFKAYADKARNDKAVSDWLCNHVSLAGNPKNNATTLNPQATSYINANPGRLGIIMMDFACDDSVGGVELVNAVINQNVRYVQGMK